jgi:hypothetical protein
MTKLAKNALRMKVAAHQPNRAYCTGTVTFDDGTEAVTPVTDFSDLRRKATDHGLAVERSVVVAPETVAWLKDQEGWPDSETVGRV